MVNSDDSEYEDMIERSKQNKIDLSNLFLVEIFNQQLVQMNKKLEQEAKEDLGTGSDPDAQ